MKNYDNMTIGQLENAMMDARDNGWTAVAKTIEAYLADRRYNAGK